MAVSLMGMAGEHFAVAVYPTPEGVYDLLDLGNAEVPRACTVLETEHLQLSFEDRDSLQPDDRRIIKALGLRFRGAANWSLFRAHRACCFPWFVSSAELRVLCVAVEQVPALAPRFRGQPAEVAALHDAIVNEGRFLTRVPLRRDGVLEWVERAETVARPTPSVPPAVVDNALLRQVAKLPAVRSALDVDLVLLPSACRDEPGQRPYFPSLPLVVESASLPHPPVR